MVHVTMILLHDTKYNVPILKVGKINNFTCLIICNIVFKLT